MRDQPAQQQPSEPKRKSLLDEILAATEVSVRKMERISEDYQEKIQDNALSRIGKAIVTAKGLELMRAALDDKTLDVFWPLMNTSMGFKTDRGPHISKRENQTPYDRTVVRNVLVQAFLNGVFPFGNEFNIIAGNLYITKEGYQRKMREIPGLTDLFFVPGTPKVLDGARSEIRAKLTWKLNGQQQFLPDEKGENNPRLFIIPTNDYTGPDAAIGKCERKALKRAWEQIHGSEHLPDDDDVGDAAEKKPANGAVLPIGRETVNNKPVEPAVDKEELQRVQIEIEEEVGKRGLGIAFVRTICQAEGARSGIVTLTMVEQAKKVLAKIQALQEGEVG